ncbi:MAG: prepilin-type N-terminal cleavage/methylation domain-containing protein, partial [Planctomycetes bacterium]|nr:prepilin-type N-terminal cleavage/methylation domain-containing protein [Planctomycetota bacterium]
MLTETRKPHAGFTLVELLIVVVIISILISIMLPVTGEVIERVRRVRCATNLKTIVQGCMTYASDHRGRWPNAFTPDSTRGDLLPDAPGEGDGLRDENTEDHRGVDNEDAVVDSTTAGLWLLVVKGIVIQEAFICPSTEDQPDFIRNPGEVRDFLSRRHISYSYQNLRGKFSNPSSGKLAVLADRSPFFDPLNETDDEEANSFNHQQAGQNVAFADARVEWFSEPYYESTGDWFYRTWTD